MLCRSLALIAFAALCVPALAQVHYEGSPYVIVPESSIPHGTRIHTNILVYRGPRQRPLFPGSPLEEIFGPAAGRQGSPDGYHPADINAAYSMPSNGGSDAIAIVDAYDNPDALSDFNFFSQTFGLPTEPSSVATSSSNQHFQVVYAGGSQPSPNGGWMLEECLDLEWAHAMAPNAKVYLVEAQDSGDSLYNAVTFAASLPGVREISMSWGSGEFGGEDQLDSIFVAPGVVFFASSGDSGGQQLYPSESHNVVAVGGTTLHVNAQGVVSSETAWGGSGGGPSQIEPRPSYQNIILKIVGSARGAPDEAAVADPGTGVAVYSGYLGGWNVVGGTSVACPVVSGITNTRNQFSTSSDTEHTRIYKYLGSKYYRDITQGSAGSFNAAAGWDYITGCGCPLGLLPIQTPPLGFAPNRVTLTEGQYATGNTSSLVAIDGNLYSVLSGYLPGYGQYAGCEVDFTVDRPGAGFDAMDLSWTCKCPFASTTQVFAYNWTTSTYDVMKASSGAGSMKTYIGAFPDAVDYVNPSTHQVRCVARAFIPARLEPTPFIFGLDQTQLQATVAGQ